MLVRFTLRPFAEYINLSLLKSYFQTFRLSPTITGNLYYARNTVNNDLIENQLFFLAKKCDIDNRTKSNMLGLLAALFSR